MLLNAECLTLETDVLPGYSRQPAMLALFVKSSQDDLVDHA